MAYPLPCRTRAQKCRLRAVEWRTSGGKLLGSIGTRADTLEGLEGTKNPPQVVQGRALVLIADLVKFIPAGALI